MKKWFSILALCLALVMATGTVGYALTADICSENAQTYPITAEKINVELWYPHASSMAELADFNDAEFYIMYEDLTNMHIDFIVPASGTENDSFQLLFASDDMPDMLYTQPASQKYRDGEDAAIEDGYFINMAEYLDYAPNYKVWLDMFDDFGKAVYTDAGNMYGMWGIWLTMEDAYYADHGIAIRQDFLDAVNMDIPETYDEWYEVLCAFRDQLGIEAPLYSSKYGIDRTGEFMAGYGVAPYFYQEDGKILFGPMQDGYKEYLTLMNKWWNEGLLDRDFATRASTGVAADNDMMLNDKIGSLIDWATRLSDTYISRGASNENFYMVAAPQPVKQIGDTPAYRDYADGSDRTTGYCCLFSVDSDYIEECIRWNDGFYAQDIYLQSNYGIDSEEGVVWFKAEDGHRIGDYDFRYSNPDGLSSATVLVKYWTKNPLVRVEAAQIEQADENKQSAYKTWSKFENKNWISTRVTMTTDENSEFASLYADIETYVQECNVKFIMGQMDLADYDTYRQQLTNMGIERCIELQQAALDRYYAR